MSNPAATQSDFARLSEPAKVGILAVLKTCMVHRLSVRCEAVGRDVTVVIGRGYSSPKYWVDYFGNDALPRSEESADIT